MSLHPSSTMTTAYCPRPGKDSSKAAVHQRPGESACGSVRDNYIRLSTLRVVPRLHPGPTAGYRGRTLSVRMPN
jgi:hypothetical protein